MNTKLDQLQIKIPLTIKEHNLAKKQLNQHKKYPQKAKQAYLNTLAKSAVDFYLQCQNFDTDWLESESNSNNLLSHLFSDTADLLIKSQGKIIGKLQCRPVLPDAEFIDVPVEVWDNRIGFVAVKLDESLREANLLGFIPQVEAEEVALNQLQTLDDLPFYLNKLKETTKVSNQVKKQVTNFSQWLEGIVDEAWKSIDELINPPPLQPALNFRDFRDTPSIKRCQKIDFQNQGISVNLIVTITPNSKEKSKLDILVEVINKDNQTYLPFGLNLILLEKNQVIGNVQSRHESKNIYLDFSFEMGDNFDIQLTFDDESVTKYFVV